MAIIIQLRRDIASNWTSNNPTLALGEPGLETDSSKMKIGDGVTPWNLLPYSNGIGTGVTGVQGVTGLSGAGDQGVTGLEGIQGVTGVGSGGSGVTGPQGETGLEGPQGDQGVTGPAGTGGGVTGPAGDQGETGLQGTPGLQGVTGLEGSDGSAGDQGETGLQGIQGVTGVGSGGSGVTGPQGETGLDGDQGDTGIQGVTGPAGTGGSGGGTTTTWLVKLDNQTTVAAAITNILAYPSGWQFDDGAGTLGNFTKDSTLGTTDSGDLIIKHNESTSMYCVGIRIMQVKTTIGPGIGVAVQVPENAIHLKSATDGSQIAFLNCVSFLSSSKDLWLVIETVSSS